MELVARNEVTNQEQLQRLLRGEGVESTQATISRDLRDLGITKGPKGYVHIALDEIIDANSQQLGETMQRDVQSVTTAGTLVVLRTAEEQAGGIASSIDQAGLPQCLGAVAGRDTVFIATRSSGQAAELARLLNRLCGSGNESTD